MLASCRMPADFGGPPTIQPARTPALRRALISIGNGKSWKAKTAAVSLFTAAAVSLGVPRRRLDLHDVRCPRAFITRFDVELDSVVFGECFEPRPLDGRMMYEHIRTSIIGTDKAVSLLVTEPLNRSSGHSCFSSEFRTQRRRAVDDHRGVQQPVTTAHLPSRSADVRKA